MSQRLLSYSRESVKTRLGNSITQIYPPSVIRAFIFDLDGTLVDSLPGIALALNHALTDAGLPTYPQNEVISFIGDGMKVLVERALQPHHPSLQTQVFESLQKHYQEDWKEGTTPYPGIVGLLKALRSADYPLAVLSNKPHQFTQEIVESLFPSGLFSRVQGHCEGIAKKPDPTSTLQIVSEWNLKPQEVAYVGDSTVDLKTAQLSGLVPLIFSWGYGTPEGIPLLDSTEDFLSAIAEEQH